jgi:putative transposase
LLLSVRHQCVLLGLARSSFYFEPLPVPENDLCLMRVLDELYLEEPTWGSRKLGAHFARQGMSVNRKRLQRLRRMMGLETIWCRPRLSQPGAGAQRFPYLLRGLAITRPNQVWCSDITYIPMPKGCLYLVAVMDWYSRKVLAWRLSNSLDVAFCLEVVRAAVEAAGCAPEIFNTDQGCQFTSAAWIELLQSLSIVISHDGKGRWMDNVFIERLWRTLKHDEIYLKEYPTGQLLEAGLQRWFKRYNTMRPHQALDNRTPAEVYAEAG